MAVRAASWAFLGLLFAGGRVCGGAAGRRGRGRRFVPGRDRCATRRRRIQTRFVMDFSRKIDLHAFTLADPYRVVVDIPQVTFQLPPKTGESGRGLIKAFRFGLVMQGGSRMVFDLAKPVRIEKAFVIDAAEGEPARLVLDLAADRSRELFAQDRARRQGRPRRAPRADAAAGQRAAIRARSSCSIPAMAASIPAPRRPSGEMEKDIVLDFAQRLRDRIEKAGKYRVLMTRTDDTFMPLADRVRIARRRRRLAVRLHPRRLAAAPGGRCPGRDGLHALGDAPPIRRRRELAEKENRADVIAGVDLKAEPDDVAGILIDLAERETKSFSLQFAHKLVGELKTATRLHKNPLKSAGFRVLRAPDVPSVLVELGYVSNRQDLQSLLSETWRNRTAETIAKAIETYFATHMAGTRAGAN